MQTENECGSDKELASKLNFILENIKDGDTIGNQLGIPQEFIESLYSIAYAYFQQADYKNAFRYLDQLLIFDHYDVRALKASAKCLKHMGEFNKSIQRFSLASVIDPGDSSNSLEIGICLFLKGDIDTAAKLLKILVKDFSDSKKDAENISYANSILEVIESKQ